MATTTTTASHLPLSLPLKIIAGAITAVIAAAVAVLLFPHLFDSVAAVEIPDLRSWLRPPYLYFVLNCIILTIAASSRLHHNHHNNNPPSPLNIDFSATDSDRVRIVNHNDNDCDQFWFGDCGDAVELKDVEVEKESTAAVEAAAVDKELVEVEGKGGGGEADVVAGRMEWEDFGSESARGSAVAVVARRPTRSSLGGVNPRSHEETLETTWKSITHGPQVPLTPPRVRTEPSAGHEELNRKVEAFIERFNEEMRLQRQQSMQQFMETINRAA